MCIIQDNYGFIWIGTHAGLNRYDGNGFTVYESDWNNPNTISSNYILSMCKDRDGTLWIGTEIGLNRFNLVTQQVTRYLYNPGDSVTISNNKILSLCEDGRGGIWIGTDNGLNRFDLKQNRFIRYMHDPQNQNSLSKNAVRSVYRDTKGLLWIGTAYTGLNRFNRDTDTFTRFSKKDGLPDNTIYAILEDDNGNLWVSTNKGISRFNPKTGTCRNYDINDGLQSNEFNQSAACKSRTGEIIFGGINGLNAFFPDSIRDNVHIPPVVITGFKLFNKPVPIGRRPDGTVILEKTITATKEITLPYYDNVFSFEFAVLNYITPDKNQYAYMMDGLEKEWNYVGNRRYVTYTNVSPGTYVFKVKGSNNDGIWNEQGASVSITITPPIWDTWWFTLLLIIIIAGVILIIFKAAITYVKQKSEKERLGKELKLKADFTAMLVHDLRNPLQSIVGYSELLQLDDHAKESSKTGIIISKSANTMINLINDMLDVYKFEAHKMVIKKEDVIIGTLLYDTGMLMKPLLSKNNILLDRHIEVNAGIQADPNRISRVMINFLSNAIKFSPENGTITASIKRVTINDRSFQEFSIADQGPGIESSKQNLLFNAYAQIEDKTGTLPKGTGLGLAVSKMIIEAHSGFIGYRSGKQGGSEFYFQLPEH